MVTRKKYPNLTVFTDGGARGNPGPAAVGVALYDEKGKIAGSLSKGIGAATNNIAEYMAVLYGLQEAVFLGAKKVLIKTDSELVARQIRGEYKVKDPSIRKLYDLVLNLMKVFDRVDIEEIPRESNKAADKLVNQALDMEGLF